MKSLMAYRKMSMKSWHCPVYPLVLAMVMMVVVVTMRFRLFGFE